MSVETEKKNQEAYLKLIDRFWGLTKESRKFVEERLTTKSFDSEFMKHLRDSEDQRIRWDVDFSEAEMQTHFSKNDPAYEMFTRKFNSVIAKLQNEGVKVSYKAFMDNKILFRKNETKLKKVFEVVYSEEQALYYRDAEIRSTEKISEEIISKYIVKTFEYIGTMKKPCKKLQLVLSLNLCDWLLASTGGSISSCLNMEGGGNKYWAGLPLLAGDPNRAMLYVSDGTKKEFEGITVDNCMTRSWVILTRTNRKSIIRWYSSEILSPSAIKSVTGDGSFQRGMDSEGKNEITPIFLEGGITTTIYMDDGYWEKGRTAEKFRHAVGSKGGFQYFAEDLTPAGKGNFDFRRPWNDGSSDEGWKISSFKKNGLSIKDYIPVALCGKCGERKSYIKNNGLGYPVCFSCYNKEFFTCESCGQTHETVKKHYEGFAVNMHIKEARKLCNNCYEKIRKCECCGLPIMNGANNTMEGATVCNMCVANKGNGYHKCSSCNKVSKKGIMRVYDVLEKKFSEKCKDHMPVIKDTDVTANKGTNVVYQRKPYADVKPCSRCGSFLPPNALFRGVCPTCKENHKKDEMIDS